MEFKILDSITTPEDVNALSLSDLVQLSSEVREFLISSVAKTGGHIGANLGVIELTIAMHHVFTAADRILFDTGHQGYTHKLLTGRKMLFSTLNQPGGMSRFLDRKESSFDVIDASHAGTAISIATGFAEVQKLTGRGSCTVALVGDGALVEGMSMEGLNFAVAQPLPLIITINDNGMAIPPNVGGIRNLFSGKDAMAKARNFFEGLGFNYIAVEDGHNIADLVDAFQKAKEQCTAGAVVVHVKTEKGRGLAIASGHPYKLHFSMPFDPKTGEGVSPVPAGRTYGAVAGGKLHEIMGQDQKVVVLTPSTPYASFIDQCFEDYPERTIDVGMAEQHALGMACGLAFGGVKPFLCYQSTFMQRAFDQLMHDAAFMNVPVTILAVRSGFSGLDSATHHGIYDLSYLRAVPNLEIFYPGSTRDLELVIESRARHADNPMVILYPYEQISQHDEFLSQGVGDILAPQVVKEGDEGTIFVAGNCIDTALDVQRELEQKKRAFGVVNLRWIKPFPKDFVQKIITKTQRIITIEENVLDGGLGASFAEFAADQDIDVEILRIGLPSGFVEAGNKQDLIGKTGIDCASILHKVKLRWDL